MERTVRQSFGLALAALIAFVASPEAARAGNNLHLIDADDNGYALYRTGRPGDDDIRELCRLGVTEMMVLSGDADKAEFKHQKLCPTLKVVYNLRQTTSEPVSESFLREFDQWVEEAQADGKKIAFRCQCGCHRTGRLAGYYQMKYQGLTYADAAAIARKHGKFMIFYPHIFKQMRAMEDYIAGRACSTKAKYCVRDE